MLADLTQRILEPEVMDDAALDAALHCHALSGLSRLNWLSASTRILWGPIARLAGSVRRPLRLLDVATGAGDHPLLLWRRAKRAGIRLECHGIDVSPVALAVASQRAARAKAPITFSHCDVLRDPLPEGFDAVACSLFLHHLNEDQARLFLAKAAAATGKLVLVSDLVRNRAGLALAHCAARALTRSSVVHVDAPRSVRAAFLPQEALALAESAGLCGARVRRHWPCRFLLAWSRP